MSSITMSRVLLPGALAFGALGAVAAFDVVSATAEAAPNASPFAGSWSGTWTVAERGVTGTFDWTISDSGQIKGDAYNATADGGGDVDGHVHDDGKLHFVGFNGFAFQGTAEIDDDGNLVVAAIGLGEGQSTRPSLVAVLEPN